MKRLFSDRKRIVLYVDAKEYARIEARAPGSVSAYVRHIINCELNGDARPARASKVRPLDIPGVTTGDKLPRGPARCACGHTKEKHYQGERTCQVGHCSCTQYSEPPE